MGEPETKTGIGATTSTGSYAQLVWKADDRIKVFYSSGSAQYVTLNGGVEADFSPDTGEPFPEGSSFLGLYPYREDAEATLSSKQILTVIPEEQAATANSFDPAAMITVGVSSTADKMAFYNVCSGLRFTLSGTDASSYKRIELSGNAKEMLAGSINISCLNASAPFASPTANGSQTVTLLPPNGDSFKTNTTYYVIFRPGEFPQGFTVTFKDADGKTLVTSKCSSYVEFKRGIFASINGVDIPSRVAAIRDGELLSVNGTANCYIVSKSGSYKFPLSRANEKDILSSISSVKVLWETDNTANQLSEGSIITDVVTNKKNVYFKTPGTIKNGNAVIAAYRGNDIVWSWHIWVCDGYDPSATKQLYTGKNAAMMDRNLGALSSSSYSPLSNGLFYQWGRKDPFPGPTESYVPTVSGAKFMSLTNEMTIVSSESVTATVEYAIAHPATFITTSKSNGNWLAEPIHTLWEKSKTVYDPCPAGWKVPEAYVVDANRKHVVAQEAWSNLNYTMINSYSSYGVYLDGNKAWYPNNGYISTSGTLLMVGFYSCYWSCTPQSQATYAMEQDQTSSSPIFNPMCYGKVRGEGHSVRCVEDK